jgi:hypothetical protein
MVNYADGKIYKIVSDSCNEVYIGSTTQPLSKRLAKHKDNYKCFLLDKGDKITSHSIIKHGDAKIILIELYPCSQKCELEAREYHFLKLEANKVNKIMPTRTKHEHYIDNKKEILEHKKLFYNEHKEAIIEKTKQYYENNKKVILEKSKVYRNEHEQQIKARIRQVYLCDCGCSIQKAEKARHERSKKHQLYLSNLTYNE